MSPKRDIQQINAIAREFSMTEAQRRRFGDYVEALKDSGERGTKNERGDFTYEELREIANEFMELEGNE